MSTTIHDEAWAAVLERDALRDGAFVYAVVTTGVYCRPSCGARRPKRDNTRFFDTPGAARAAGFRACKRCRPDGDDDGVVEAVRLYIERHAGSRLTLADLAALVDLSPAHLQRVFTRQVGMSPRRYQQSLRVEAFRDESRRSSNVLEASNRAGFGSSRGLYDEANSALGMTPGQYKRGGAGVTIRVALGDTSLGRVLVGMTQRGVCAVLLGDDDAALDAELRREFPKATLERAGDARTAALVRRLVDGEDVEIPLDVPGTDFQRSVWAALAAIPIGETRTYAEIARSLGMPSAARAVGAACGRNRCAVVIPCHRVVRGDGGLGGYRWGLERKEHLLTRERRSD